MKRFMLLVLVLAGAFVQGQDIGSKPTYFKNGIYGGAFATPPDGIASRLWYNTTDNKYYYYDGSSWTAFGANLELDPDLDAIAALEGASGILRKTALDTWTLDTNNYLTTSGTAANATLFNGQSASFYVPASRSFSNGLGVNPIGNLSANRTISLDFNYLDNRYASGFKQRDAVRVATASNITLSGLQTVDGVSLVASDRVLVKNQTAASANGIYVVASGAWSRSTDFDQVTPGEVEQGASVFVEEGTQYANTGWTLETDGITLGSTALTFIQYSGANAYVPGDLISFSGNTINHDAGSWVSKSNLTGATVISNLSVDAYGHATNWTTRNLTASNIGALAVNGDGSQLTNVNAATLDGLDSPQFLRSDQSGTITGNLTVNSINTGLGLTEVYLMNQHLRVTDEVNFFRVTSNNAQLNNWALRADTNDLNFSGLFFDSNENGELLLRNSAGAIGIRATGDGTFASGTINTGLGATEVHLMNQNLRTTDNVTFARVYVDDLMVNEWAFRADTNDLNFSGLYFLSDSNSIFLARDAAGNIGFQANGNGNIAWTGTAMGNGSGITNVNAATVGGNSATSLLSRSNHTGTQAISTVSGLQTALDGKASTSHSHSISNVTNLQTSLDQKVGNNTDSFTGTQAVTQIITLTQAQYDAIGTKSANTLYIVL